jgi:hypothetical protein
MACRSCTRRDLRLTVGLWVAAVLIVLLCCGAIL